MPLPADPIPPLTASRPVRLAVRALLRHEDRLLIVNAYPPAARSDLWCAPGGGVEPHASLPENLVREVFEETRLTVAVGAPALVNEFHAPGRDFQQVDIYFRCTLVAGDVSADWRDPEGVVTRARWVTRDELDTLRHKPDSLGPAAWGEGLLYDPLEPLVR